MKKSVPVGRYFGIKVYLHYSWFFIFTLLAWGLATEFFPERFAGHSVASYWILGVVSAVLLFVSVLMHELSHSLVAKHFKMHVASITLFFFGGVASLHEGKMKAKQEFYMALAGPVLSLVLAALFFGVGRLTDVFFINATAAYLLRINLIIAAFNMVPGFPLDGGRVFRAVVWMITKDYGKATKMATVGGRLVAYALIFLGAANMFSGNLGGLWFVLIGGFLLLMTTLSYEQAMIKEALLKKKVKEFLVAGEEPKVVVVRAKVKSPAYKVLELMLKKGYHGLPVYDGKKFVGVVKRDDILGFVHDKEVKEMIKEKHLMEVKQ